MSYPIVYDPAKTPASGPQPGARALMAWALANSTATNLGIYNNRAVRGGQALSLHAEGRALDLGFPHTEGGTTAGWALAEQLREHSADLGIQCLIYARKIWTNTKAKKGWRPYPGTAAHNEHIHVELTRQAAARLTVAEISRALGGERPMTPAEQSQRALNGWLPAELQIPEDGDWGPRSHATLVTLLDTRLRPHIQALEAEREAWQRQRSALENAREEALAQVAQGEALHSSQAQQIQALSGRVAELVRRLDAGEGVPEDERLRASLLPFAELMLPLLREVDEAVSRG